MVSLLFCTKIKDYQNVWKVQKGRNLKMFIRGFLLFASRNTKEINSGYKQQKGMYKCIYFNNFFYCLKMLGLYLYTLVMGHKSCNMLSILNKLTLIKELQNFVTNDAFWTKSKTTKQNKSNIKTLAGARNWTAPPSQMRILIAVKLFKAEFAGHTFSTNSFFL